MHVLNFNCVFSLCCVVATLLIGGIAVAIGYWALQPGSSDGATEMDKPEDMETQPTDQLDDIRTDIRKVEKLCSDVEVDVDVVKKRLDILSTELQSEKDSVTDEEFQKDVDEKITKMKSDYETVHALQQEMKKSIDNVNDTVRSEVNKQETQLHNKLNDFTKENEDKAKWFQAKVDAMEEEIQTMRDYLSKTSNSIEVERETKQALAEDVKNMDEMMELLRVNTFNKSRFHMQAISCTCAFKSKRVVTYLG